jgi:hypothetical protein
MKLIYFILLPFFTFSQVVAEEKKINIDSLLQTDEYQGIEIERYTVKKGERMRNIYLKYKITPGEIYRLNPDAKDSLKVGSVLLIPLNKKVVYREWLNPKWVKQNEAKLKREKLKKDSLEVEKRIAESKRIEEEKELKRIAKNKPKNNLKKDGTGIIDGKKEEVKKTDTPIANVKKPQKTNDQKIKDSIAKKLRDDFYAKEEQEKNELRIKDSISRVELSSNEKSNKKDKKKKKEKKVVIYGSPDDHDVKLDAKNKEHYILHEIEEGETLVSIAKKYKVPDYALLEFNKRVDFNKVMAGNLMKVPNVEKEIVQSYIINLIEVYKSKNIKYDKDITKKKFAYTNEEDE